MPAQRATPSFISGPFLSDWIHFHKRPCVTQTPSIGGRNSLCFVLEGKLMDIESTHKGVNQCFKNATQALQQRPEWPAVTLTRHERFGPRSLSDSCILVESPLSVNSLPRDTVFVPLTRTYTCTTALPFASNNEQLELISFAKTPHVQQGTQHQRPESPTITMTWHASKSKTKTKK